MSKYFDSLRAPWRSRTKPWGGLIRPRGDVVYCIAKKDPKISFPGFILEIEDSSWVVTGITGSKTTPST